MSILADQRRLGAGGASQRERHAARPPRRRARRPRPLRARRGEAAARRHRARPRRRGAGPRGGGSARAARRCCPAAGREASCRCRRAPDSRPRESTDQSAAVVAEATRDLQRIAGEADSRRRRDAARTPATQQPRMPAAAPRRRQYRRAGRAAHGADAGSRERSRKPGAAKAPAAPKTASSRRSPKSAR